MPTLPPEADSSPFVCRLRVRSYELDALGHVNHAVYLNYLEQARYDALEAGGFPPAEMEARGWAVHIVRVEVDYRRECRFGDHLEIHTRVERFRSSSMVLGQELFRIPPDRAESGAERTVARTGEGDQEEPRTGEPALSARLVAVWIGPDGRPLRIPSEVREALRAPH